MQAALWAVTGGGVSLALVVLTLRSKAVDPLPGLLLAAGVALLSAANAVALVDGGSPSYADVPGLLAYPALAAAVTAFQRDRVRRDRDSLLDALVVTVAAAQVGWLILLEPVLTDSSTGLSTTVLTGSYALCNLLVLGVSARLGFALLASHDVTGRLLIAGLLVGVASDVAASLTEVRGFELGWLVAFALLVLAVRQPGMATPELRPVVANPARLATVWRFVVLLALACLVSPVLVLTHATTGGVTQAAVVLGGAVFLFALALIRIVSLLSRLRAHPPPGARPARGHRRARRCREPRRGPRRRPRRRPRAGRPAGQPGLAGRR